MLYSDYARKMAKLATAVGVVKKYKILIISIIAVILAVIATLLGTRGLVYDSVDCPISIEYGSEFSYRAGAFLGGVEYEFCEVGDTEWTSETPIRAGRYYVRAVSSRTGGAKSYGAVHEFEITPKQTNITIADSVVYGEKPAYTAELAYGDTLVCGAFEYDDVTKTSTVVRADISSARVFDVNGEEVTSSYNLVSRYGIIVFIPRDIEITVTDATSIYDGMPFSSSDFELTGGSLADGDGIVAVFDKKQTDVGSTDNPAKISVSRTVLNSDGKDVTANYRIKQVVGTLTVEKREVVVNTRDASHVYDGKPFSCIEFDIADGYSLADGDMLVPMLSETITDVGETKNRILFEVHDKSGNDVSNNYSVVLDAGNLTVEKRDVYLKTGSSQKIYDGTPVSDTTWQLENAISGHVFKTTKKTELTRVGTVENVLEGVITTADGETDKTDNYNIIGQYGTLTVTKRDVTVKTSSSSWVYDGNAHSAEGNFTFTNLVRGHNLYVKEYTTVCDVVRDGDGEVASVDNIEKFGVTDSENEDCTDCFNILVTYGKLTVNPRAIEVVTATDSWTYDGKDHHNDGVRITYGSLVGGQSVSVTEYTIVRDVIFGNGGGVAPALNELEISIVGGEENIDVTGNYAITVTQGTLTVSKRNVTFCVESSSKVYDGEPLSNDRLHVAHTERGDDYGIVQGHDFILPFVYSEITDVLFDENGDIIGVPNTVDIENTRIYDEFGNDVTVNYNIIVEAGTLTVTPRPLKLITSDNTWEYDGKEHVDRRLAVEGLVQDHDLNATRYTFVTNVVRDGFRNVLGVVNYHEYEIVGTKQTNYEITYVYGTLTITPRKITVETASNEWVYDGNDHYDLGVKVIDGMLVDGHGIRAASAYNIKNVGEGENCNSAEILHVTGYTEGGIPIYHNPIETDNYEITYVYGTLKITPRPIKIITPSQEWEYDGQPHCELNGVIIEGETCGGDKLIPTNHTVITDVVRDDDGEVVGVDNVLDYVIAGGDTDNYEIKYEYGTLTVTPRAITVKICNQHVLYGSNWASGTACGITNGKLVTGHISAPSLAYIKDGEVIPYNTANPDYTYVPVGVYEHKIIDFAVITDYYDRTEVTDNYDVTIDNLTIYNVAATITVDKRRVIFDLEDETCVYNGKPQSPKKAPVVSTDAHWIASFEEFEYEYAPECTLEDVGTVTKTVKITVWRRQRTDSCYEVTDNYDIAINSANFTVIRRDVTIAAYEASKQYDDEPLTAGAEAFFGTSSDNGLVIGHNVSCEMTADSTITYVGTVANKIDRSSVVITDENGKDVTHNYNIIFEDGVLEITPRKISVRGIYKSKIYDGMPLTNDECEVIDGTIVLGQTAEWHCLGSITDVGNAYNPIDLTRSVIYDKNGKDVTWNYEIIAVDGVLEITQRTIYVTTDWREKVYDGFPLYGGGQSVLPSDGDTGLVAGHSVRWGDVSEITEYYVDENGVEGIENAVPVTAIADERGFYVTDNYNIVYDYGRLVISKRPLLISTATNEWEYDGMAHFDDRYELEHGTIVQGNIAKMPELVLMDYTEITDPGVVDNMLTFAVRAYFENNSMWIDLSYNYEFQLLVGTLTITEPDEPNPSDPPGEQRDLVRVTAERDGDVYLRLESYGEYTGTTNWGAGSDYSGQYINYNGKKYSVNYLTSVALEKAGLTAYNTEIEVLFTSQFMSVLPYYTTIASGPAYASDVRYTGTETLYSVKQYYYSYTDDNGAALAGVTLDITQAAIERAYREYVYRTYLDVPTSTEEYLLTFLAANNINANDKAVISKVAGLIKSSASYNPKYNSKVDTTGDVAVAFLRDYKEGVCRHYATAATLVYRTLGIPARYVGGILAETKAGEPVVTKEGRAHAWVEVYIDGIGWMQVEVTGSFDGSGGGSGNGNGGGGGGNGEIPGDTDKVIIAIQPVDTTEEYSGRAVFAIQDVFTPDGESLVTLNDLVKMGYTYTVTVSGSRIEVGETTTEITQFTLFDSTRKDVTDEFFVRKLEGSLMITKPQIRVHVPSLSKEYDGTPLVFEELLPGYYWYEVESMPDGVARVVIDMAAVPGITAVGSLTGNKLTSLFEELGACAVFAPDGSDITDNFTVFFVSGGLTVMPRGLVVVAGSSSKVYDGEPLTCDTYSLQRGTLAEGHRLEVVTEGSVTDIGSGVNRIVSMHVFDADGNDVTNSYLLMRLDGVLTVTR